MYLLEAQRPIIKEAGVKEGNTYIQRKDKNKIRQLFFYLDNNNNNSINSIAPTITTLEKIYMTYILIE
jgi:hypothetical protein